MKLHRNAKLSVKGRVQRAAAPGTPGRGVPERLRCAIRSRAPAARACRGRHGPTGSLNAGGTSRRFRGGQCDALAQHRLGDLANRGLG
jgi:hypothetical protein